MRVHALLMALAAASVMAQSPQASVSGTVRDPQGGAVPGATVAVIHVATGVRTAAVTNQAGFYSLQALPIGTYSVRAEMAGFQAQQMASLVLTTGQSQALDFQLQLGQVSETVNVTHDAPVVETRSSEASQLIEAKSIEDIPLGDRRAMNIMEITGASVFIS
jgi:transcriptional regulator of nitric oxide reductase